jgi:hypothetical protein
VALVTLEYYQDTFLGEPVAADEFPRYELRAEELILSLIRMNETKAAALPEDTLTAVQKAICAQVEYFQEYGIGVAIYGKEAGGGFTVGKVSVNNGSSTAAASGARSMIAPAVYVYLEQTGLLNPAVPVAGMPPQYWGWWM